MEGPRSPGQNIKNGIEHAIIARFPAVWTIVCFIAIDVTEGEHSRRFLTAINPLLRS